MTVMDEASHITTEFLPSPSSPTGSLVRTNYADQSLNTCRSGIA